MEIIQSAQFLFFVGNSLQPCSKFMIERLHSKRIRVEIDDQWKEYLLEGKVDWPGKAVYDEAGRFKVQLPKRSPKEWPSPGKEAETITMNTKRFKYEPREAFSVTVLKINRFHNPGICELVLSPDEQVYHYFHAGQYLCIYMRLKGKRSKVPFYPTITFPFYNMSYPTKHVRDYEWTSRPLRILINDYGREETFQNRLCTKLEENSTIFMSYPKGVFCPSYLKDHGILKIFVETVGIGPALSVVLHALQTDPLITVNMMFFSHQEADEIYRDELEDMAKREPRFEITYLHKQHRKSQSGWRRSLKPSTLGKFVDYWSPSNCEYAIAAGHRQFVFPISTWLVTEYGYPNKSVYRFITV